MTKTYKVTAKRWAHGWELDIEGVGVTQSNRLRDAEMVVRDYLVLDRGEAANAAKIEITADLGGLEKQAADVHRRIVEAAHLQEEVAELSRELARQLRGAGLSGADAAAVMEISPQRFSQLAPTRTARAKRKRVRQDA